jgi:hypothetical protein
VTQQVLEITTRRALNTVLHGALVLNSMTSNRLKDIAQSAVQLNKDHQYALKVYTERLEAELEAVDKLLVCPFLLIETLVSEPFRMPPNLRKKSLILT